MANECLFNLIVKSKNKRNLSNVKKHIMGINERILYRTWSSKREIKKIIKKEEYYILQINGACAWSCSSCMFDTSSGYLKNKNEGNLISLNEICREENVQIEVFGREYGVGFLEHYFVDKNGELVCQESFDTSNNDNTYYAFKRYINYFENNIELINDNYLNYFFLSDKEKKKKENLNALLNHHWYDNNFIYDNGECRMITSKEIGELFDIESFNNPEKIEQLVLTGNDYILKELLNRNNKYLKDDEFIKQLILKSESMYILTLLDLNILNNKEILKSCFDVDIDHTLFFLKDNNKMDLLDINFQKEIIKNNPYYLKYFDDLKSDKAFILSLDCVYLNSLSDDLKNDKDVVLKAVKRCRWDFEYVDDELKNDKSFVMEIVKINGNLLEYVSKSLKDDKDVVMEAVKHSDYALCYASERLRDDEDVVRESLKHAQTALLFANRRFRENYDIVMEAVKNYGFAIQYADDKFKDDKGIVLEAVKHVQNCRFYDANSYVLNNVSDRLRDDEDIIKEALKYEKNHAMWYASEKLKDDENIVKEALKYDGNNILCNVSDRLKDCKSIVMEVVKKNKGGLLHASARLRDDKDVVLEAVKSNGMSILYASERLKSDMEIINEALKQSGKSLMYLGKEKRKDKQLVMQAVKYYGKSLEYANKKLRDDEEIVFVAVKNDGDSLKYASDRLRNNKKIVMTAVKNGKYALCYASQRLRDDEDVVRESLKRGKYAWHSVSNRLKDKYKNIDKHLTN